TRRWCSCRSLTPRPAVRDAAAAPRRPSRPRAARLAHPRRATLEGAGREARKPGCPAQRRRAVLAVLSAKGHYRLRGARLLRDSVDETERELRLAPGRRSTKPGLGRRGPQRDCREGECQSEMCSARLPTMPDHATKRRKNSTFALARRHFW